MVHKKSVLVLGGSGFIGSQIATKFVKEGYKVTVIDGFLPQTGGRKINLLEIIDKIELIPHRIEDIKNLDFILSKNQIIIDSMAWTSHQSALEDPIYDLDLNTKSHICLIKHLKENSHQKIVYLGSRSQFGKSKNKVVKAGDRMDPIDVQGINKMSAELYFNIYSDLKRMNVVSLRFGNTFGINQKIDGNDIGLIGSFIKDLLLGKTIKIYGKNRNRNIIYVKDLAEIVYSVSQKDFVGFSSYNISGHNLSLYKLAINLQKIIRRGEYEILPFPEKIKLIDIGDSSFTNAELNKFISKIKFTTLNKALKETVEYFKNELENL